MQTSAVTDALRMAWFRRRPAPSLIFHSDRGSQYCSHEFQQALEGYEMKSSMSRKGDCWDNAPTESLWGRLKVGRLYGRRFATRREAMDEVMDWLNFYNHKRLHSTLRYVSPMTFEQRWFAAQQQERKSHNGQPMECGQQGQGHLGVPVQTLGNWVRLSEKGQLKGAGDRPVSPEQMELARLRAENARLRMERDILGKATAYFAKLPQ